jgi:hypothetical protein
MHLISLSEPCVFYAWFLLIDSNLYVYKFHLVCVCVCVCVCVLCVVCVWLTLNLSPQKYRHFILIIS